MLWLALLVGFTIQGNAAPLQSSNVAGHAAPSHRPSAAVPFQPKQSRTKQSLPELQPPSTNSGVCYTIRSYVFKTKDGVAPTLVRQSTCTPSTVRSLQVTIPPKVRVTPLVTSPE